MGYTPFQLLLDMQKNLKTYPSNITLLLGGYNCPFSLEVAFCNLAKELKININILYVYGIAEVESAIFLGRRNFETKDIMYKLISKDTSYLVKDVMLFLIYNKMEFETGDYVMELNNNLIIKQNSQSYSKEVSSFLESWSYEDWRKNTGYIYIENSIIYFQTRKNIETTSNLEIEYFNFLRTTNLTWLDKPNWK